MSIKQIKVPDIGADSAEVIEILVSVGDDVEVDQSIAVLESDKASMEMPAPEAGKVVSLAISVGDQVTEGADFIELEVVSDSDSGAAESSESDAEEESQKAVTAEEASEPEQTPESAADTTSATASVQSKVCFVPDIGADEAEIIEVTVAVGDEVSEGDSICVAESDKASVEIPAEFSGIIEAMHVTQGDKVAQGNDLVTIAVPSTDAAEVDDDDLPVLHDVAEPQTEAAPTDSEHAVAEPSSQSLESQTYQVPDVGSNAAEVIEVMAAVGDEVTEGDSICAVETDKASVEVPAPVSGKIEALFVKVGDQIGQGQDFVTIASSAVVEAAPAKPAPTSMETKPAKSSADADKKDVKTPASQPATSSAAAGSKSSGVYAGPATRKQARELGVDLALVRGTGNRGRILIEDVNQFVKQKMQSGGASLQSGEMSGIPSIPAVDWAKFGDIDVEPMSRIHKATAANMVRNWLNVPHVTHFDEADVTELEKYRAYLKAEATSRNIKMTPLAFLLKASAVALIENPKLNSSLHENGEDIVHRKYLHIGIAVDTPNGLMVPVIRDVDKKDIWELAADVITMANKAKDGKLGAKDMQGGSFTISSLGAMGGTGFTPIVSAPQVAILGVSKTSIKPIWNGSEFLPRQMMPLSVSYDHRAVNGADAGKFMTNLVTVLEDLDRIWNG